MRYFPNNKNFKIKWARKVILQTDKLPLKKKKQKTKPHNHVDTDKNIRIPGKNLRNQRKQAKYIEDIDEIEIQY